jgi:hypothetical protein
MRFYTRQSISSTGRLVSTAYVLVLLILLAGNQGTANAQQDIRLSTEPLSLILPDYAKIQSAARIGDITLVVWGTTRRTSDTDAASMLVMQLLRDTTPIGSPQSLTLPDARPFDFVQVLPLRDRFLVVWNDMRNGDSVAFMRRVDTTGVLDGDEERFNTEPIDFLGIVRLEMIGGYRLVWNGHGASENQILWREIDSTATILQPIHTMLTGTLRQVIFPSLLPGIALLQRGEGSPIIYRIDGTLDTLRGEAARHFTLPYYLDADGSLVTLDDNSVKFYHTLFDTVAYRTVQAPAAVAPNAGTWLVTKDTTGWVMLLWTSGGSGVFYGTPSFGTVVEMGVFGSRLTPADTFETPKLVKRISLAWLTFRYTQTRTYLGAMQIRGCGNQYRIEMYFDVMTHFSYQLIDTTYYGTDTASFNVDGLGRVFGESQPSYDLRQGLPLAELCSDSPEIPIARIPSKTASEIVAIRPGGSIRLSAQVAFVASNVPQQTPCLAYHNGLLSVSWYALGTDSLYTLGRWNTGAATLVEPISAINYNKLPGTSSHLITLNGTGSLTQLGNTFLISSLLSWQEKAQLGDSLVTHRQYLLHTPTDTGWQLVKRIESPLAFTVYRYGYNPQDGTIVGSIGIGPTTDQRTVRVFAVDGSGQSIWDFDSLFSAYSGWWISTVPVSADAFIFFNSDIGIHYKGKDTIGMLSLSGIGAHDYPVYSRLLGNSFLRSPMGGKRSLELFDLDGKRLNSSFIDIPPAYYDLIWVQNPEDSGFVVLWGSESGVWMTWLDKQLTVIRSNIPISEQVAPARHPAAVFRNDTLFVVWEDYRNGVSDIYGTALHLKTLLGVESQQTANESVQTMSVAPNPARDVISISTPNAGDMTLSIIDSYGITRLRTVIRSPHMTLDIQSLPSGSYRIVAISKGKQYSIPLTVMH